MPAEYRATSPAALQQLSDDIISLYRRTADFGTRANSNTLGTAERAAEGINRLLNLAYNVLIRRNEGEYVWFRRAHVQQPLAGWRESCRASWHDQAALEAGKVLWDFVGSDAGRFPPELGDRPPLRVRMSPADLASFRIWTPDLQW
ncbi:MAG TPA: hypothetical protein VHU84_01595, partial [Lacipirellulaceae bacterium]|nr:hypothetical protein [Lacipirellulaceae bacterium]